MRLHTNGSGCSRKSPCGTRGRGPPPLLALVGRENAPTESTVDLHNVWRTPSRRQPPPWPKTPAGHLPCSSPTTGLACTHHERLTRAPRRHRGEKARRTVKALFELLLVVDAALEEAVHYDVLVVQVPHLSRKDLEVLNGLCRVEGALGAKHLRHRRLERQVVLVVVSDQHQVANSTRVSSASLYSTMPFLPLASQILCECSRQLDSMPSVVSFSCSR